MFAVFASEARTVKMFYFARLRLNLKKRLDLTISGKQSKSPDKAEKPPNCDWSRIDS